MLYPSINEIKHKADSRYTLVILAAKRARDIIDGKPPLVDCKVNRPVSIAAREINEDLIKVSYPEDKPAKAEDAEAAEAEGEMTEAAVDTEAAEAEGEMTEEAGDAEAAEAEGEESEAAEGTAEEAEAAESEPVESAEAVAEETEAAEGEPVEAVETAAEAAEEAGSDEEAAPAETDSSEPAE